MKYLTITFSKPFLLPLFVSILLTISIASCSSPNNLEIAIPTLERIEQTPQAHYKELGALPKQKEPESTALDAIKFPNKAHNIIIKIISPAYLDRKEISALTNQMQPPANSSKQTRAELDFLLELQETRTEEQVAEALRMHEIVYFPILGMRADKDLFFEAFEIYGADFNPNDYPKTRTLLGNIMREMRIAEFTAKNHFLRARPRQLEANLAPLKKMSSSSFASGHTLWAYMQAYLMGALIPEKRDEFLDLAYKIGFTREILGVHYPSDEEAARKLANQLLAKMWEKPTFMKDFQAAQLEWKKNSKEIN